MTDDPAVELVNVTQHYGVRPVLRGVSLRVGPGELAVVVGPNGMGKTTLMAVLAGGLAPQHGYAAVGGLRRRSSPADELAARRLIAYLPDHPWLPGLRTGREFLLAVGRLYDVPDERLFDHVGRLLTLFDLASHADTPIRSYSGGQKKKIALGGALVADTPVLLLDEPFGGGLDPAGILALKRVLRRRADDGAAVVLTSPVPEIVEEIADRVIVLHDGAIVADDTVEGLRRLTGQRGPLGLVLERLVNPDAARKLAEYFGDAAP